MPSIYRIRSFVKDGFYHIFNRGVEKRNIFRDIKDFEMFSHFLQTAVCPKDNLRPNQRKNFHKKISVISYCLMPNHFHFLIQQHEERVVSEFIQSLINTYTLYFNKKYHRVGSIFQGRYKSKLILDDEYLLHLSRYIHLNPKDIGSNPLTYAYSSINAYISRGKQQTWIDTKLILTLIGAKGDSIDQQKKYYRNFCLNEGSDPGSDPLEGLNPF